MQINNVIHIEFDSEYISYLQTDPGAGVLIVCVLPDPEAVTNTDVAEFVF